MIKALFLDRDGTLMLDKVYLADPAGVELFSGVSEGLARAKALGMKLFLFTNQSGIGRGYYTLEDAERVNARLESNLGLPLPVFDGICIAPEAPDQPMVYRKPSPRFLRETMDAYCLRPEECLMVGDSAADVGSALSAGIRPVALRTGKIDPFTVSSIMEQRVSVYEDFFSFVQAELS